MIGGSQSQRVGEGPTVGGCGLCIEEKEQVEIASCGMFETKKDNDDGGNRWEKAVFDTTQIDIKRIDSLMPRCRYFGLQIQPSSLNQKISGMNRSEE